MNNLYTYIYDNGSKSWTPPRYSKGEAERYVDNLYSAWRDSESGDDGDGNLDPRRTHLVYDPMCGTTIDDTDAFMVSYAIAYEVKIVAAFNGTLLIATKDTQPGELAEYYRSECARLRAEYLASPEYAAQQAKDAAEIKKMTAYRRIVVASLPTLDLKSCKVALSTLQKLLPCVDRIGVGLGDDHDAVYFQFGKAGWVPGECCGDDFVKGDPVIEARWIVGQVLDCWHPVGGHFASKWMMKYGKGRHRIG